MSQSSSAPASSLSTRLRVHSPRRPHALTSHVRVASESASTSNATSRSGGVLEHLARQGIRRTQDVKPEDAWGLYGFRKCSAPVGRQKDSLGAEDQDHRDTGSGDGPKIPPVSELRTFSPADKGALSSASAPVPDGFGGYQLTPELFPSSPSPSPALTFTHYAVAPAPPAAIRPLATTPPAARILPGPAPSSAAPAFQGGPALSPLALPRMRPLSTPDARRTPLRLPAPLAASSPHLLAGPPAQPAATDYAQPQHARQMRTVSAATARLDQYDPRSGMSPSLIQAQQDRLRHWRWSAPVQAPPSLPQPGMPMQQYARYPTTAIAPNSHRRSLPPSPLTRSFMAADGSEVSAAPFRGAISSSPPSLSLSSLPSAPHPQAFVRQYPAASANIVLKPGMLAPACISRSCSGSDDASGGACGAEPRLIQSVQRQEQKQGQGQRAQSSPMLKIAAAFKYAAAFSHNQLESREVKRNGDVASKSQQQQHGRRLQRRARGSSLSDDPAQGHVQDAPSSPRTEATSRTQSLLYKMRNGRKGPASDSVAAASAPPVPHGHAMPSEPWSAARGPRGGVAQSAGSQRRQFAGEQRQTSSLRRSDRSAFLHPQQPASNSVAAVEMSRPKSGSRSTQHSSSSKASLSAYQPISGSQGRKRALRSGASSSSITSASSRHTQHSRASASSYSSSSVSASSRSTGHSYRRIALTAAQELSRALGSASQSSDSRYAICAEFRRDSSGSASAPPSVCVSRKSSDASKNTKVSDGCVPVHT
ncbi:hypothetical protein K437DRAFT_100482 [Tilletiaria anomala UBC 951]|uniref:Uncharacterized protein n=1 Tax=Tilletiaria anomala (strain ATCC 24038 / CBS 436.72 / UBC 951) TaxID=1037660 RepID=A0A066W7S2_TILAU|nr:uncharacterized protein K437DRAFT_100482 [Tilletiaria anomala UBC 951]KDN47134.1 hypothetical protein K437DRAFT_100482 [Tilletiaria anomala UBC 951]